MNFDKLNDFSSAIRNLLALAFTPVVTGISIWLIAILAYGHWDHNTEEQRIYFIGVIAILNSVLVGLGGQWFQRNRLAGLKGTAPGGVSFDLTTAADPAPVELAAPITTTTTTTVIPQQPTGQV